MVSNFSNHCFFLNLKSKIIVDYIYTSSVSINFIIKEPRWNEGTVLLINLVQYNINNMYILHVMLLNGWIFGCIVSMGLLHNFFLFNIRVQVFHLENFSSQYRCKDPYDGMMLWSLGCSKNNKSRLFLMVCPY